MRLRNTLLDFIEVAAWSKLRQSQCVVVSESIIKGSFSGMSVRSLTRTFLVFVLSICAMQATLRADNSGVEFEEGLHYHRIVPAIPVPSGSGEVVVLELFWYGCPHCYSFEKHLNSWEQNKADHVKFVRMPVALNRSWIPHARMYYALEKMGEVDRMHSLIFEAIHVQGRRLRDVESVSRFLSQHDIDTDEFEEAYNSSYVEEKMRHSGQFVRDSHASSVPTVIVNGKYRSTASAAGGHDLLLQLTDELVQRETE